MVLRPGLVAPAVVSANRSTGTRRIEIGLADNDVLSDGDARDVARPQAAVGYGVVYNDHCQLVATRALYPRQLAVQEQANLRVGGADPDHRSALGVTALGGDVFEDSKLWTEAGKP